MYEERKTDSLPTRLDSPQTPAFLRWTRGSRTAAASLSRHSATQRLQSLKKEELHAAVNRRETVRRPGATLKLWCVPEISECLAESVPESARPPLPSCPVGEERGDFTPNLMQGRVKTPASAPDLVEPVVVDRDVVQLGAFFDVLEMSLGGREGKLVFVHVGDVPQDVIAAALGDHLSTQREREKKTKGCERGGKETVDEHTPTGTSTRIIPRLSHVCFKRVCGKGTVCVYVRVYVGGLRSNFTLALIVKTTSCPFLAPSSDKKAGGK